MHSIRDNQEEREESHLRRQSARELWHEHQETGLHVTGAEVMAWLETWGCHNEKEAPSCHG